MVAILGVVVVWMLVPGGEAVDIDIGTSPGQLRLEALEWRDSGNRLVFPSGVIEGTSKLRWEDRDESGIDAVMLFAGLHPSPVLGIWNKLYRVDDVAVGEEDAWRMRARITVHVPLSRDYEAEWFRNMNGRRLEIVPAAGPLKSTRVLNVDRVLFERMAIHVVGDGKPNETRRMFLATLYASESVPRALYNSTFGFLTRNDINTFLGSLVAAILAGLIVLRFSRRRSSDAGRP